MRVCSFCQRCYDDTAASCVEASHPILTESRAGSCEMIAGYRLEFLLESGGKCDLYRARHTVSGRSCFVRIISANENDSQRFFHDAKVASALFHPNVTGIYDTGVTETGVYIVTEDAGGQTLRELLNMAGAPSLLTAVQIARQTAEALDALHSSGLVHHALRPENIVLTTGHDGRLLVRIQPPDLGGVVSQSIVSDKFLIESALGLIKYFAPEQFAGEDATVQTDVYSLGVVFYEMLAGVPPFDTATAAGLIHMHRNEPPPEIKIDNFDLRMLVTHSLMESLQKQPRTRTHSAMTFARQLRHIEQLATHSSTPPPAVHVSSATPALLSPAAVASAPARSVEPVPVQPSGVKIPPAGVGQAIAPVTMAGVENNPTGEAKVESLPMFDLRTEDRPAASVEVEHEIAAANIAGEPSHMVEIEREPEMRFASEQQADDFPEGEIETVIPEAAEGRSAVTANGRIEPSQVVSLIISVPDLHEADEFPSPLIEDRVIESPAEEESETSTQRSRMKQMRRRLHATAAPEVNTTPRIEIFRAPEPVEDNVNHTEAEPKEIPLVRAEPVMANVVPIHAAPKLIEWDQPEDDIPSLEDVQEARMQEPVELPIETGSDEQIVQAHYADRKVTVSEEFQFLSSVIRDADGLAPSKLETEREVYKDPSDSIFSAYAAQKTSRSPVGYRSLLIGGGIVAMIALFLGGDVIVNDEVRSEKPAESVIAQTEPEREPSQSGQASAVTPDVQTALSGIKEPRPDSPNAAANRPNPPVESRVPPVSDQPQPAVLQQEKGKPEPDRPEPASPKPEEREVIIVGKKPPIRSTLVISANNGKIESRVEPQDRSANSTRQRIVVRSSP